MDNAEPVIPDWLEPEEIVLRPEQWARSLVFLGDAPEYVHRALLGQYAGTLYAAARCMMQRRLGLSQSPFEIGTGVRLYAWLLAVCEGRPRDPEPWSARQLSALCRGRSKQIQVLQACAARFAMRFTQLPECSDFTADMEAA